MSELLVLTKINTEIEVPNSHFLHCIRLPY